MLLCAITDVTPGMVLGAQVTDPKAPDKRLLLPGVKLDASLIASVRTRGVTQLWVEDDLTKDLDNAVASELTGARLDVYKRIRSDLQALSRRTLTVSSIQAYREAVLGLVWQSIASATYASMTDTLFASDGLATHASNVAYLSLLAGLHAEDYIVAEQPRLLYAQARDMSILGLAGMLHDIGKSRLAPKFRALTERSLLHASLTEPALYPAEYVEHLAVGRELLESANAPARVTHTVLNHHQRYDGTGWPDMTKISGGRIQGPLKGRSIHIFARVVAAANTLDNLLRDAESPATRRPPVAALHDFASAKYDGWFDPVVRRALLLRIPPFAVGTDLKLSDGRRAVVVAPASGHEEPCRPVIRILTASDGKRAACADCLDLREHPALFITHALGEEVAPFLFTTPPKATETLPEAEAELAA